MQEIVCGSSGKPIVENTRSCRCECPALMRLLRSKDNGWYIAEHQDVHNHALSQTYAQTINWPSHKHIDVYSRDLVKQLRQNNFNLSKVYNIIGSFFGKMENVPFTKRTSYKVLDFIRVTEIPKKHIVKRWTRDVLPTHLVQYQRDNAQENPFSFRHFNLYMQAMELVRMGDSSVAAYEHLIALFKHCASEMKPFTEIRDGLGLENRLAGSVRAPNRIQSDGGVCKGEGGRQFNIGDADSNSANESANRMDNLLAPAKRKQVGRPTTSKEKAPYEGLSKRTRFCGICRQQGHKRTTYPEHGDVPKQPRKPARCKNCGVEGHRRNNCHKAAELRLT